MWDYSKPGRVRWVTIGSMPTNLGNLPIVVERQGPPVEMFPRIAKLPVLQSCQCGWQGAKFEKSPSPKRWEVFLSMYITYCTFQSVNPPHGQWPAPIGSWRVYLFGTKWRFFECRVWTPNVCQKGYGFSSGCARESAECRKLCKIGQIFANNCTN